MPVALGSRVSGVPGCEERALIIGYDIGWLLVAAKFGGDVIFCGKF